MKNFRVLAILAIAIFTGVFVSACSSSDATSEIAKDNAETKKVEPIDQRGTKLGETAPDFELTSVKGEKVSFAGLKGKPSVLVFWSYYCRVREEEAP